MTVRRLWAVFVVEPILCLVGFHDYTHGFGPSGLYERFCRRCHYRDVLYDPNEWEKPHE